MFTINFHKKLISLFILSFLISLNATASNFNQPLAIDSRIKTLIYSPNEIFQLKFVVGYQSIVELEKNEEVELIAFGDSLPWNIKVLKRRIFIKSIDPGVQTNMTIVTNKRIYLLEISSSSGSHESLDDQLVYIVRFFYPEVDVDKIDEQRFSVPQLDTSLPLRFNKNDNGEDELYDRSVNYNYTFAGTSEEILPIKIFDDGVKTFFYFANDNFTVPGIYAVDLEGNEIRMKTRLVGKYVVVDSIEYQFSFRWDRELVCVFNEALLSSRGQVVYD